jgi:penicillin-binding protein 1A
MKNNSISKTLVTKLVKWFWISSLSGVLLLGFILLLVAYDIGGLFGPMPSLERLENPQSALSSEVYSSDMVMLGKYFRENRTTISFDDLGDNLVNALLATEDIRFYKHSGIDPAGLIAIPVYLLRGEKRGSSTISQQLAKNLFNTRSAKYNGSLTRNSGIMRLVVSKIKEWIFSIEIERSYTKEEIMTMYLNTVEFGGNAYGIQVASETFFNTSPDSLQIHEAAMLVGLLKGPTQYSPVLNPEAALVRRNTVIDQLYRYDYINRQQRDSIKGLPLLLKYEIQNHNKGLATYFRSNITDYLIPWCKERGIDLYEDGLKIYTTIDSRMQAHAEAAVQEQMAYLQKKFFRYWKNDLKMTPWRDESLREIPGFIENACKRSDRWQQMKAIYKSDTAAMWRIMKTPIPMRIFSYAGEKDTIMSPMDSLKYYKYFLHCGFVAMDPANGQIRAWVGGIDHKHFKYDHVRQGKRQPGSTFKPFVYATALDLGYSPCFELPDLPVAFETGDPTNPTWAPENSDGKFTGEVFTLRKAMANSINSITANLVKQVGPEAVVRYAKALGIESEIQAVPAICLGVFDVSIMEMTGAYSAFVNQGIWNEPHFITRIEDKNGNVLMNFVPKSREALSPESAYSMVYMLRGATEEKGGTALGLNKWGLLWTGAEVGGKTGTTQNYSDGWFVGITNKLTAGAWVGGEDRSIHFRRMDDGQGARMAMPIWALFMQRVYADSVLQFKKENFEKPKDFSLVLDCKRYKELNLGSSDSTVLHKTKQDIPDEFR